MAYGPIRFQPAGDHPPGNTKIETYVSTPTLTLPRQRGREFHAPRGRFRGLYDEKSIDLLFIFFILALVLMAPILYWLRKTEK
jgi:hypothetical protein